MTASGQGRGAWGEVGETRGCRPCRVAFLKNVDHDPQWETCFVFHSALLTKCYAEQNLPYNAWGLWCFLVCSIFPFRVPFVTLCSEFLTNQWWVFAKTQTKVLPGRPGWRVWKITGSVSGAGEGNMIYRWNHFSYRSKNELKGYKTDMGGLVMAWLRKTKWKMTEAWARVVTSKRRDTFGFSIYFTGGTNGAERWIGGWGCRKGQRPDPVPGFGFQWLRERQGCGVGWRSQRE